MALAFFAITLHRMPSAWAQLVLFVITTATLVGTMYFMRNRAPISPRQVQKQNAWVTLPVVGLMAILAGMTWATGATGMAAILGAVAVLMLAIYVFAARRAPSPQEANQNYAADRAHCGQCEYDLTGNISGICPECGWVIPTGQLDVDSPGWALWWRKWEIGHLHNWRRTLALVAGMALVFAGIALVLGLRVGVGPAGLPTVMAASFGIHIWRVIAYARRQAE